MPACDIGDGVRQSLFDLTALLIKYEVIELGDIWSHLEHTLKKLCDDSKIGNTTWGKLKETAMLSEQFKIRGSSWSALKELAMKSNFLASARFVSTRLDELIDRLALIRTHTRRRRKRWLRN